MFARPFNPKRPFGTVTGAPGVAKDQDGQLYNDANEPVDITGTRMALAPAPVATAPEQTTLDPVKTPPGDDDDTTVDEKIDLLAWAQGHPEAAGLPWQSVRAAAAEVLEDISELKSKAALKAAIFKHYGVTETPDA